MARTKWVFIALAVVCLAFSSGGPAWAQDTRLQQTHTSGKVTIVLDAVLEPPLVQNAQPLRVEYMDWNDERIKRIWKDDEPAPNGGGTIDYRGPRGSMLDVYSGAITYVSQWIDIEYSLAMYAFNNQSEHLQGALSGFTREEAWGQVDALCDDLGLVAQLWQYTAMDEAKLEELYNARQEGNKSLFEGSGLWAPPEHKPDAPQEGYFFNALFTYDGLALNRVPINTNSFSESSKGSSGLFYVTKEQGVIWFETGINATAYEILERMDPSKHKKSIELEQAIGAFVKSYEVLIFDEPVRIERIAYEYLAVPDKKANRFVLRPVWSFYPAINMESEVEPVYVDAISGKVI